MDTVGDIGRIGGRGVHQLFSDMQTCKGWSEGRDNVSNIGHFTNIEFLCWQKYYSALTKFQLVYSVWWYVGQWEHVVWLPNYILNKSHYLHER